MHLGKEIGAGQFSIVYLDPEDSKSVLIKSICHAKEAASLGFMPQGRRWPSIERLQYMYDDIHSLYRMPLYTKVTAPKKQLNTVDYTAYIQARKLFSAFCTKARRSDAYFIFQRLAYTYCSPSLAKQFCEGYDGMANYSSLIGFEVYPRNIAIRPTGGLVWLDLFFNGEQL